MVRLSIQNLSKKFDAMVAVEDVSLEIEAGYIYALIGPNGSGKTTTVKMATGLYQPSSGDVLIDGISITKEPERAKALIGYIPDEPFVYERLTGREFLHLVGTLFGVTEAERKNSIEALIKIFPIAGIIDDFVENYSRGNKQKLSILAAILHNPKLLVIDEPIVGLDPESAVMAKKIFMGFARAGGSVLLCTHTLSFAEAVAGRIGLLKNGRLIREGSLDDLRRIAGMQYATLEDLYLYFTK